MTNITDLAKYRAQRAEADAPGERLREIYDDECISVALMETDDGEIAVGLFLPRMDPHETGYALTREEAIAIASAMLRAVAGEEDE